METSLDPGSPRARRALLCVSTLPLLCTGIAIHRHWTDLAYRPAFTGGYILVTSKGATPQYVQLVEKRMRWLPGPNQKRLPLSASEWAIAQAGGKPTNEKKMPDDDPEPKRENP